MSQNFERAKSRLENISTIEPLLGALRTMSMGTWQLALNKIDKMNAYEDNYNHIITEILPYINKKTSKARESKEKDQKITDTIILLIGTERGLCGKFNEALIEQSISWLKEADLPSYQIWAMGSRLIRKLEQMKIDISWRQPMSASDLMTYQKAYLTTQKWVEQYEAYAFNQFFVLFNQSEKSGQYQFSSSKLLPYEFQRNEANQEQKSQRWPPPIIETDPTGIYSTIIQHHIAASFYKMTLKSAAAEHAARFNLMQEAKDNAEEIIEELRRIINSERKRKITQEMQELAAGAGLLHN
ncbi:MAG: F0F1 ATP synthase subunit gamma [Brevefilum sp.]|nr:F0F1 ATP synthase subunit gamma [Brevefilum sp.]MDT8381051.1 F0F1 ATP synthase subunit gamma [Brevefilum sp.]MDW7754675.1 F0F1 ATP synthase subunit gamma [Brevefilum sp.]